MPSAVEAVPSVTVPAGTDPSPSRHPPFPDDALAPSGGPDRRVVT
jgi:hypothetical protein